MNYACYCCSEPLSIYDNASGLCGCCRYKQSRYAMPAIDPAKSSSKPEECAMPTIDPAKSSSKPEEIVITHPIIQQGIYGQDALVLGTNDSRITGINVVGDYDVEIHLKLKFKPGHYRLKRRGPRASAIYYVTAPWKRTENNSAYNSNPDHWERVELKVVA